MRKITKGAPALDVRMLLEENRQLRLELAELRAEKFAMRERAIAHQALSRADEQLTPQEAMALFRGYKDQDAFMRMTRRRGIRRIMVNSRVVRFRRGDLESFIRRVAA